MINIHKINNFLVELLSPEKISDYGINGIQIDCERNIKRIGFAVDASIESVLRAKETDCDLLIVHHGLFWGKPVPIIGATKTRLKYFIENDIGLIAYHLPLDCHEEYGNNIQILRKLKIEDAEPFGPDKGFYIGWMAEIDKAGNIDYILNKLNLNNSEKYKYLNFGPDEIKKIAVVSGSGGRYFEYAVANNIDLFITGDADHILFHKSKENEINVLFAGHYFTETFGVLALKKLLETKFNIETLFFDIPTGL